MLKLKSHEACPYAQRCPHINNVEDCMGANKNRANEFECAFVDNQGRISESGFRSNLDQTGSQKVLHG